MTAVRGATGPGPSKYDKVFVTKFGPKSAKRVLLKTYLALMSAASQSSSFMLPSG